MKTSILKENNLSNHLKVIKNDNKTTETKKINTLPINTLIPGFKHTNSKGELISTSNTVRL